MNKKEIFTKEQIDFVKHCGEHFEVLTGGRGHSKTKEMIQQLQNQVEKLTQENNDLEERVIHQDNIIKGLQERINMAKNINRKNKELQSVIGKTIEFIEEHNKNVDKLYYKYNNKYLLSGIKEDLLEILRSKE